MTIYQGKGINPGVAFGNIFLLKKQNTESITQFASQSAAAEWQHFLAMKNTADAQLNTLYQQTKDTLGEDEAMIIDVQRMMLEDADFIEFIEHLVINEKNTAAYATNAAGKHFSDFFASLDDLYMNARSTDVTDVANRLTGLLLGNDQGIHIPHPSIIAAEDLTPSETLQMDKSKILAFVIQKGADNSHTAILARIMNIPCIIRCDIVLDETLAGVEAAVDGESGKFIITPNEETRNQLNKKHVNHIMQQESLEKMRGLPTITKCGKRIRIYANIGSPDDLTHVLNNDAEGIGLFRSEFLYLSRDNFPTEEEQFHAYRTVAEGMNGKEVIIRTLDIGADKQVDYFKLDEEENPALGLRGIRIYIERPDIFATQLRAIYRASAFGNIAIMFPMIASVWEVQHCKAFAATVQEELAQEGIQTGTIKLGIMIETPAAVMLADALAKEADFFSVGTNDLTQYTLAIDRQNNKLDRFYDPRHPAIIKMLETIAHAATANGISAGICGELAADFTVTESLVKQGFDKLSVSPSFTLGLREKIRSVIL